MATFYIDPATFAHEHPAPCNHRIPDSAIHQPFATAFMAIPTALAITSNVCTTPRGLNLSLAWSTPRHTPIRLGFLYDCSSLLHLTCDAGLAALFIPLGFGSRFDTPISYVFSVTSISGTRYSLVRYDGVHLRFC